MEELDSAKALLKTTQIIVRLERLAIECFKDENYAFYYILTDFQQKLLDVEKFLRKTPKDLSTDNS